MILEDPFPGQGRFFPATDLLFLESLFSPWSRIMMDFHVFFFFLRQDLNLFEERPKIYLFAPPLGSVLSLLPLRFVVVFLFLAKSKKSRPSPPFSAFSSQLLLPSGVLASTPSPTSPFLPSILWFCDAFRMIPHSLFGTHRPHHATLLAAFPV